MKKLFYLLFFMTFFVNAQLIKTTYHDDNQTLEGFFVKSKIKNPKNIGVLILPAWMGIDDHAKEVAEDLSKLGYHAFVADIYGVDKRPNNTSEAGEIAGYFKTNYSEYQRRIQLALDELIKHGANKDEIAVIGYCFGGTGALEAARGNLNVKGVVSFHGGLGTDVSRTPEKINCKVLVLHGADDPYVPQKHILEFQEEMRNSKADWQMVYYANAVHAFTHKDLDTDNSKGAAYNELADRRSWVAMKEFFNEIFR